MVQSGFLRGAGAPVAPVPRVSSNPRDAARSFPCSEIECHFRPTFEQLVAVPVPTLEDEIHLGPRDRLPVPVRADGAHLGCQRSGHDPNLCRAVAEVLPSQLNADRVCRGCRRSEREAPALFGVLHVTAFVLYLAGTSVSDRADELLHAAESQNIAVTIAGAEEELELRSRVYPRINSAQVPLPLGHRSAATGDKVKVSLLLSLFLENDVAVVRLHTAGHDFECVEPRGEAPLPPQVQADVVLPR